MFSAPIILSYEREDHDEEEKKVEFIFKGFESRFQAEESTLVGRVIGAENDSLPCPLKPISNKSTNSDAILLTPAYSYSKVYFN